ncbi:MAG: hypothetical protein AB1736_07155 [Chloroflexota bacterium]
MRAKRLLLIGGAAVMALAIVAPALASTPGERVTTIQLTFDVSTGNETFTSSGPGFCRSGLTVDANILYFEADEEFKILMTKVFRCDDGSGDLAIELSAGEPLGSQTRSGGWIVTGGTGDYATAVGGGTLSAKGRYPFDLVGADTMTGVIVR